jgi:hypothetical protein
LDESIGQRALAVVDVGNDREVSDVIHGGHAGCAGLKAAQPLRRRLTPRSDVKAQGAGPKPS